MAYKNGIAFSILKMEMESAFAFCFVDSEMK